MTLRINVSQGAGSDGRSLLVVLSGALDQFAADALASMTDIYAGAAVTFDCAGIKHVNSYGAHLWMRAMQHFRVNPRCSVVKASTSYAMFAEMVPAFAASMHIQSIVVSYYCEKCERSETFVVDLMSQSALPAVACADCGTAMAAELEIESLLRASRASSVPPACSGDRAGRPASFKLALASA